MIAKWCNLGLPEEGVLSPIHPGAEGQARILSKRWDNEREHQCQEDKAGRQNNLPKTQLQFRKQQRSVTVIWWPVWDKNLLTTC